VSGAAMNLRMIFAIGALAMTSACSKALPPGQYALGLHEAYERLAKDDLPDFVANRQCGILIHVRAEKLADQQITWRVTSSGREMLNFTAILTPVDAAQTRVDVAVSKEKDGKEAYDGARFYPRPAVKQPVRPAIEEQLAALLEKRAFEPGNASAAGDNSVCNVQRAGLEEGTRFKVDDIPGMDARQSAQARANGGKK
jgi:hypothetical protein